ncbi:MAG: hypothetical protein ACK2U0_04245 [Candidatus Promineifilaceae bacterium]
MRRLMPLILISLFAAMITACAGASAATEVPTATPSPTIPPTAVVPTPDISAYSQMDLSGGDAAQGLNVAIAFRCKQCHDGTHEEKGPRFAATDDLPPVLERGEARIADPAYAGQAASNIDYFLESIFIPEAYTVPGEWAVDMPLDYVERIDAQELVDLLAWLETIE